MIRFLFRFFGLVFLALGFIFLVYDGTKSIADQHLYITRVSDVWAAVHESSLAQLRPVIQGIHNHGPSFPADPSETIGIMDSGLASLGPGMTEGDL